MSQFDITDFDPLIFNSVTSTAYLTLVVMFPLPVIILCSLGVVALLLAKDISWKMRVILINVLTPEMIYALGSIFFYANYPI